MRKYYDPTGTVAEKGGPMIRTHVSSFDGSVQPYALYVPSAYTPEEQWPLVISLHGYSSDHILNLRRVFGMGNKPGEDGEECKKHFPPFPEVGFIVASPYGFGSVGYAGMGEVDVLDVLADVKRNYSIDEDRIYLTGLSMGGEGTWHLGLCYPDMWAAIAPVCAPLDRFIGPEDVRWFADNGAHLPIYISHGSDDPAVPVECSREMRSLMERVGARVEYEEYPGVGHNAWDFTYANARIFDWFARFRRIEKPSRVVFNTRWLRYSRSYWVTVERIRDWSQVARIEAEAASGNVIEVKTSNVSAFSISLNDAPVEASKPVTIVVDGRKEFEGRATTGVARIALAPAPIGLRKKPGLEGPVWDITRSKVVIVAGEKSGFMPTMDDLLPRSDWADVEIPVRRDSEVDDELIRSSHLILVGTDRDNSLIGKINERLPVRFDGDSVQVGGRTVEGATGFVAIYPNPLNPERYALVIGARSRDDFTGIAPHCLMMPDYAVFGSETDPSNPETFVTQGYFDESWSL